MLVPSTVFRAYTSPPALCVVKGYYAINCAGSLSSNFSLTLAKSLQNNV